ncbi:MAG: hypothetical protein ACE5LB_16230, partial [Acidiferrobacterales bacterium]
LRGSAQGASLRLARTRGSLPRPFGPAMCRDAQVPRAQDAQEQPLRLRAFARLAMCKDAQVPQVQDEQER